MPLESMTEKWALKGTELLKANDDIEEEEKD